MTKEICNLTPGNNPQKTRHEAGGIARPLSLAEDFADDDDDAAVMPGDNIFRNSVKDAIQSFRSGAHIFLKPVPDAARFGAAEVDESSGQVPEVPKSDYAAGRGYGGEDKTIR